MGRGRYQGQIYPSLKYTSLILLVLLLLSFIKMGKFVIQQYIPYLIPLTYQTRDWNIFNKFPPSNSHSQSLIPNAWNHNTVIPVIQCTSFFILKGNQLTLLLFWVPFRKSRGKMNFLYAVSAHGHSATGPTSLNPYPRQY